MDRIADGLAEHFYREEAFTISFVAFRYAIQVALEMLAGVIASAMIAVALDMEWETAVFLWIFWILRSYGGGIHLSRFSYCFVFSSLVIAGTMWTVKNVDAPIWCSDIMMACGVLAFLLTKPENDRNRAVDEKEDMFFRVKLKQSLAVITLFYLFAAAWGSSTYTFVIALSVCVVYVLMVMGKVRNRWL